MNFRIYAGVALLTLLPAPVFAQRPDALVIFKDGYYVTGKVVQKKDFILDPSGSSFTIPLAGSMIYVDDAVRRIYFSPAHVQDVIEKKGGDSELIVLKRYGSVAIGDSILPGWEFESVTPWNDKWVRWFTVSTTTSVRKMEMEQRILYMTPRFLHIQTRKYNWDLFYFTKEFGPALTRDLVAKYHEDKSKKGLAEHERLFQVAKFLFQAGWPEFADKELDNLVEKFPEQKDTTKALREAIQKGRAEQLADEIDRAYKAGQHDLAQVKIAAFLKENLAPLVSQKSLLLVQDLKNKYDDQNDKIANARSYLQEFPKLLGGDDETYWSGAADIILSELNHDTLPRLGLFLDFAPQHQRELAEKKKPTQSTEEVLALAVTGWMLGNAAAEPDVKTARMLWGGRKIMLDYLKSDNSKTRAMLLASFIRQFQPTPDVVARLIRMLPPINAYPVDKITTEQIKLDVDLPDASDGTYLVQLPPNYHHQRQYPVLVLLHGAREKPSFMMARFSDLAAQHGFILVTPLWGRGLRPIYGHTAAEHAIVLDSLRDVRRRFQVDSDRVYLFGWEQGADAAFDIGLSHPDQFAAVLPMNGVARYFLGDRYWPNAQYLPFYIIQGDRNGASAKANRALFSNWVKGAYPSLYVEFKGRVSEWYGAELSTMFEWMSRKKRQFPAKELGRYHTGGGQGEEFATMRTTDNRFYWIGSDGILDKFTNSVNDWVPSRKPATLQAHITVGNETDTKKGARIWTQINIRTSGVKQVSVWLAPNMVDFTKPIRLRVNSEVGPERTIHPSLTTMLEDYYLTADKQRLWFARIDLKL